MHVCIFWYTWRELKDVHVSDVGFCLGFEDLLAVNGAGSWPSPTLHVCGTITRFILCVSYWSLFRSKFGNVICAVNNGFNLQSSWRFLLKAYCDLHNQSELNTKSFETTSVGILQRNDFDYLLWQSWKMKMKLKGENLLHVTLELSTCRNERLNTNMMDSKTAQWGKLIYS